MGFFSSCGKKRPLNGKQYTFILEDAGEKTWNVKYETQDIVTHTLGSTEKGKPAVIFTGVNSGKTNVTIYRCEEGKTVSDADNVYVITLEVDRRGNVTEPTPYYGEYRINCGNEISGAEWDIEYTKENIHCSEYTEHFDSEGDGMQSYNTIYAFTGRHPGAAHILVTTFLPWCDITNTICDEWLYVDSKYRVSPLEMTGFQSLRISVQDMRAGQNVYEAVNTGDGVKLSNYLSFYSGSSDKEERRDEITVEGDETLYRTIAGLLNECDVRSWDGFNGSDPDALDGSTFIFEATLIDGTTIYATGSNSFPEHYNDLISGLTLALHSADANQGGTAAD